MTYILISALSFVAGAILCDFLKPSIKHEEAEIEQLFRKHDYLVKELTDNKVDAEVAYLEYLYGVDNYMRGKRENNKS